LIFRCCLVGKMLAYGTHDALREACGLLSCLAGRIITRARVPHGNGVRDNAAISASSTFRPGTHALTCSANASKSCVRSNFTP
jgi:hypothetical protein